jgi:hypothetical protein
MHTDSRVPKKLGKYTSILRAVSCAAVELTNPFCLTITEHGTNTGILTNLGSSNGPLSHHTPTSFCSSQSSAVKGFNPDSEEQ